MAHSSIQPSDDDRYYAGGAINIPFQFSDEHDSGAINLDGMTVEFRVKESLTDEDEEALVQKSSADEDTEGPNANQITITDPAAGECDVHINTGDTAAVVEDGNTRIESKVVDWHCRVIDSDGQMVTAETGTWEIFAS